MDKMVYDCNGKEKGVVKLNEKFFLMAPQKQLIYDKIKNELANRRQGTACAKTRAEVRGGGRKPWRQKGTGRARHGSIRSPIWVGGGVVFGPKPRDYSYALPKKMARLGILATLVYKFQQEGVVQLVEDFTVKSGKTKDGFSILTKLNHGKINRTLLLFKEDDFLLKRALRNIPWLKYMSADRLSAHALFYAQHIIIMDGALKHIEKKYSELVK